MIARRKADVITKKATKAAKRRASQISAQQMQPSPLMLAQPSQNIEPNTEPAPTDDDGRA